jgi:hypothetical protein
MFFKALGGYRNLAAKNKNDFFINFENKIKMYKSEPKILAKK